MKSFIIKTFIFLIAGVLFLACFDGLRLYIRSTASFKIPENKTILVAGNSITAQAISNGIYTCTFNTSSSGTSNMYAYAQVCKFVEHNPQIDTVLWAFNYGVSQAGIDSSWLFNSGNILERFPRYLTLLHREDIELLWQKNRSATMQAMVKSPVSDLKLLTFFCLGKKITYKNINIVMRESDVAASFSKLKESVEKAEREQIMNEKTYWSKYQMGYLLKAAEFCKQRGVTFALINPPTYKPERYGHIAELNEFYRQNLSGILYLDYSAFPLDERYYQDIGHLNNEGATIFSEYLQKNLAKDLEKLNTHAPLTP